MPNEFIARNGIIANNNSIITGSLSVSTAITASNITSNTTLNANGTSATFNTANTYINSDNIVVGNNSTDIVGIAANTMYFPGSGSVGIGTTNTDSTSLRIVPTSTDAVQRVLHIGYNGSMSTGTHGSIITFGNATPSTAQLARIGAFYEGSTFMGSLRFYTNSDTEGANPSERMRITQGGNVGIGVTTPNQKLEVGGTTRISTTVGSTLGFLQFDHPGAQTWKFGVFSDNTSTLSIGNDLAGTFSSRYLNITNAGNVGIGTSSPNAKLDVNGNSLITGSLTVAPTAGNVELQVQSTGVTIGNAFTDIHRITGSIDISGSIIGAEPVPAGAKLYLFYNY